METSPDPLIVKPLHSHGPGRLVAEKVRKKGMMQTIPLPQENGPSKRK